MYRQWLKIHVCHSEILVAKRKAYLNICMLAWQQGNVLFAEFSE